MPPLATQIQRPYGVLDIRPRKLAAKGEQFARSDDRWIVRLVAAQNFSVYLHSDETERANPEYFAEIREHARFDGCRRPAPLRDSLGAPDAVQFCDHVGRELNLGGGEVVA
jgi:hypothetical protein